MNINTILNINKGKGSFSIIEVLSECGCTVPIYTEEIVNPGDSGTVKAVFNPKDPISKEFNKTLTIRVSNDTALIKVKGHIIPFEQSNEATMFTRKIGDTWFRSGYFQFGKMTNNRAYTKEFDYYNGGSDSLILRTDTLPNFLTVNIEPQVIAPKTVGKIEIEFDAVKRNDYGYVADEINLITISDTLVVNKMFVSGNIAEYFPDTIDLEKAPKAVLSSPETVNLGTVFTSTPKEALFKIKNEGIKNLIIRKISSPCSCIQIQTISGKEIKSGEELVFTATLDGKGRKKGNVTKSFYIYVNDPKNSILQFRVKASFR